MGDLGVMKRLSTETEAFYRKRILPEEDRATLTGETWTGGYRWFRSENIVCLEHYRAAEAKWPKIKVQDAG
jgi:hypothetical protein